MHLFNVFGYVLFSVEEPTKCVYRDVDFYGHDISHVSASDATECQILCSQLHVCQFWTFIVQQNVCALKTSNIGYKEISEHISGSRDCIPQNITKSKTIIMQLC